MEICLIEWGDAWIDTIDITKADAAKLKPVARQTVGFFVKETSEGVVLCTDFYDDHVNDINTPMFIPFGMISNWYFLEVEKEFQPEIPDTKKMKVILK